jgi:hypothetical protein
MADAPATAKGVGATVRLRRGPCLGQETMHDKFVLQMVFERYQYYQFTRRKQPVFTLLQHVKMPLALVYLNVYARPFMFLKGCTKGFAFSLNFTVECTG